MDADADAATLARDAAPPPATAGPLLRFCPESNDLLYPQEDKERKVREEWGSGRARERPGRPRIGAAADASSLLPL
jgi:hypothetical protein